MHSGKLWQNTFAKAESRCYCYLCSSLLVLHSGGGRGAARRSKSRRSRKEVNKLRILLLINACFAFGSNFFFPFFLFQVIIFGHSPPGKYERSFQVSQGGAASHSKTSSSSSTWSQHWLQERFNHRYLDFVRKYSKIIIGQFFGHQHSDSFRIFRDEKGTF